MGSLRNKIQSQTMVIEYGSFFKLGVCEGVYLGTGVKGNKNQKGWHITNHFVFTRSPKATCNHGVSTAYSCYSAMLCSDIPQCSM